MAWDRGAWERATSNPYSYGSSSYSNDSYRYSDDSYSGYSSSNSFLHETRKRSEDKKKKHLKENFGKFLSKGWKISQNKKNQYLNNNYYNTPYLLNSADEIPEKIVNLIVSKSNNKKFLVVCNDEIILDKILLELKINDRNNVFKSIKSATYLKNLNDTIKEFKKVNLSLFNKYSVCIFPDIASTGPISDLKILSQNLQHIDNSDAKILNEFIKLYWQYYDLSNNSNIDLNLAEKNLAKEISILSNELNIIRNYVNRLDKIFNIIDVNIDDLNDFDVEILKNNPSLVDTNQSKEFISILEKYNNINKTNKTSSEFLDNFLSNDYLLGVIANYKRLINGKKDYETINNDILYLKNSFESLDLNFTNLNDYFEIESELSNYENVVFIDNPEYLHLNEKLNEFLKFNLSFNEFLDKCKKNVVFNLDSNSIYLKVNESINNIVEICANMGIKLNSLSYWDNHQKDFKILEDYYKISAKKTETNQLPLDEYAKNLFDDLKNISKIIINKIESIYDFSELDSIIQNINILNRSLDKIGVKIHSLKEVNDSFMIIANVEKDSTHNIFTSQTSAFLANERNVIHSELDTLKNSMDYLTAQINIDQNLMNLSLDDLKETFKNYIKLDFIIDNLETYLESTDSFEDIIHNYNIIIQSNSNLINEINNLDELKIKLNQLKIEFLSIDKTYNNDEKFISNVNPGLMNNISSFKNSIKDKFDELVDNNVFDKSKLETCDVELNIHNLSKNIESIRDFVVFNGLYEKTFDEIVLKNKLIIKNNTKSLSKIENSTIYDFCDVCNELDMPNYDFDIVKNILELSSKLELMQNKKFHDFDYEDINELSKFLNNSIQFTDHVNEGIINKNFRYDSNNFEEINSKINSIKKQLVDLKLDDSILRDFSPINLDDLKEIEKLLEKLDEIIKDDSYDMDVKLKNYRNFISYLLDLCNDYYIEFEIDNIKFNSLDFKDNILVMKSNLEYNINLFEVEMEMLSFEDLISNNLCDIWKGPLTNINSIKNKLEIDEEFTRLYKKDIFSRKSVENMNMLSESDVIFLNKLKTNDDDFKFKCNLFYENKDYLISELNKLNNLNHDEFKFYLDIFISINKIFKSAEISECINLLEYNIKHENAINRLYDYENKLKEYSVIYYKYFNRRQFDISLEEMNSILKQHFKFTKLIDENVINKDYVHTIKSHLEDFIAQIILLDDLKTKIIEYSKEYYGKEDVSFDLIKTEYDEIGDAGIILMNLNSVKTTFNNKHVNYFDYVYVVYDNYFLDEDKLLLFLISKNKLSSVKVKES